MLVSIFLLILSWHVQVQPELEAGPVCLYKSEICLEQSKKWIENYACIVKSANVAYPYSFLNRRYIKLFNEKSVTQIDRFIGLQFDKKNQLQSYQTLYADFGKANGHLEKDDYFKLIFEEIGEEQLFHYTQLDKREYRDYIGTYEYDDCSVKLTIPDGDIFIIEIVVSMK